MSPRPTLDALLLECEEQGVFVRRLRLPEGWDGAYHHPTATIYLAAAMPDWQAIPTLMHELEHARRGDDGHQAHWVEARIDRAVACRLISSAEYAQAESGVGHHVGALAVELDVPVWVVEAYRSTLRR